MIFVFGETKILIECQGSYWHADPFNYSPTDLIKYPGKIRIAESVWAEDYYKLKLAQNQGFNVVYIWDRIFVPLSFEERIDYILELLENYIISNS